MRVPGCSCLREITPYFRVGNEHKRSKKKGPPHLRVGNLRNMKILVLIKQVPDSTDVKIDPKTNTLKREGVAAVINPFDMYAIEEAVRLKERFGGKISVLTMGPPQADAAIREALSMGVDEGYLVCDRAFAGSDTWATSYTLAGAIKKLGAFDLIICGKQDSDGDNAQVGPGICRN